MKMKYLLAVSAMLGCLLAGIEVHAHESGIYDIDHLCISCDVEKLAAHAALPILIHTLDTQCDIEISIALSASSYIWAESSIFIRGPPEFS